MSSICLVCISLRAGGTERIVTRIANYLCSQHTVSLILLSSNDPFYILDDAIKVYRASVSRRSLIGWRWYPKIIHHIRASLKQAKPDLVLCFGEAIAPVLLPVATFSGYRTIVFNRASPLTSLQGVRGLLNPLTYPLAHRVVVQTRRSVELMQRRYRLSRFAVLPNPVDVPAEVPLQVARGLRILNIGTLGGMKNQRGLILAFAQVSNRAGWRLELIGEGPDQPALQQLVSELGLSDSVSFLGKRQDVGALLQDAQIFAFSSLTEGFPNALAEALAAGCACISYDCPTGPSELIEDGINGLLVPTGDQAAFARGLDRLMGDPDLRVRFSLAARDRIQQFSAARIFDQFEQLIRQALPGSGVKGYSSSCDS